MVLGIIYWAVWRVFLPKIFGYDLVPAKVTLDDGTIVNVVRPSFIVERSFDCTVDQSVFCLFQFSRKKIE